MIRLGLRLTLSGGREAAARLAVIVAAVALGVGLLLSILAAINATATQNSRNAWLNTGSGTRTASQSATKADTDPLWWLLRADHFDGKTIGRVDVAATGPSSPVPPGLSRLPGPGEFYASPALDKLLHSAPAAELADRYPGHQVGTVGNAGLPGPDSLIVVIGHRPDQLAKQHDATQVTTITTATPSSCNGTNCTVRAGIDNRGIKLILSVAGTALIFPVLILIGTATRLAATRREQRFAAMRLVGATPRQISMLSAVESTLAALVGTAVGFGLFYVFRMQLALVNLTSTPYFAGDLTLRTGDILLVCVAVPVGAAITARIALRRVQVSPLGVTRRVTPRPPRVYRVIPLAAGIAELSYTIGRVPRSTNGQIWVFVPGILLVLTGLVIAGPWLTMAGARLLARQTSRPALLVAGRRLADDPKAGFRAVSGLVLALCVTSAAVGIIGSLNAERSIPQASRAVAGALDANYTEGFNRATGRQIGSVPPLSKAALGDLNSVPGVKGVLMIHTNPLGTTDPTIHARQGVGTPPVASLASCTELAKMPANSACASGAQAASVPQNYGSFGTYYWMHWPSAWPAADISPATRPPSRPGDRRGHRRVDVGDRTRAHHPRENVSRPRRPMDRPRGPCPKWRTARRIPATGQRRHPGQLPHRRLQPGGERGRGLRDRKRPFSLLRLTGTQLGVLRRIVLLESAVPLLVVAVVAIGMGFLTAQLFVQAQFRYSIQAPGIQYYAIVLTGLVASLGVIASTMPLLRRITGPETARNE